MNWKLNPTKVPGSVATDGRANRSEPERSPINPYLSVSICVHLWTLVLTVCRDPEGLVRKLVQKSAPSFDPFRKIFYFLQVMYRQYLKYILEYSKLREFAPIRATPALSLEEYSYDEHTIGGLDCPPPRAGLCPGLIARCRIRSRATLRPSRICNPAAPGRPEGGRDLHGDEKIVRPSRTSLRRLKAIEKVGPELQFSGPP